MEALEPFLTVSTAQNRSSPLDLRSSSVESPLLTAQRKAAVGAVRMAKYLTDKGREFRKLVVAYDGHQTVIADVLGISVSAVSTRLNSELHGAWWKAFKRKRSKRRQAARQRRWRARAQERMREQYRGGS